MCWGEIYRNDLPGSFVIHKVINSCSAFSRAKQKWGYAVVCTEVKRKEKKPGQIGLALQLFLQRLLQLAQPLKKWPSSGDLEESSGWFSPWIHFLLSGWRGIQVHGCWFTLWPLRYTHTPLTSYKVHQQIETTLWLMSTDVFLSPRPSVEWIMLSWTTEGPSLLPGYAVEK